jgi:hypothetical protein
MPAIPERHECHGPTAGAHDTRPGTYLPPTSSMTAYMHAGRPGITTRKCVPSSPHLQSQRLQPAYQTFEGRLHATTASHSFGPLSLYRSRESSKSQTGTSSIRGAGSSQARVLMPYRWLAHAAVGELFLPSPPSSSPLANLPKRRRGTISRGRAYQK